MTNKLSRLYLFRITYICCFFVVGLYNFISLDFCRCYAYNNAPLMLNNEELLKVFQQISPEQNGNRCKVRLLWKNDEAWYARWKIIEKAQKTIDCTYFNIANDIFGLSFLGFINKKAKEGVKVRLMVDWKYTHFSSYMKGMKDVLQELSSNPNVQIRLYNSVLKGWEYLFEDIKKLIASNHDKIIIVDGKWAIVGGRNIAADHFAEVGENKYVVRDADLLLEGESICKYLLSAFEEEWKFLKNSIVKPDIINLANQNKKLLLAYYVMNRYLQNGGLIDSSKLSILNNNTKDLINQLYRDVIRFSNIKSYASFEMWRGETPKFIKAFDKTARVQALNGITAAIIKLIDASKYEIIIQNPYVLFTDEAKAALIRAANRNVKIIVHTNSGWSTDEVLPTAFLINELPDLFKNIPTLRLFVSATQSDTLHSKVFVFDRLITIVGSYNMDPMSQDINSEVVVSVCDRSFSNMVALKIYRDIETRTREYRAYIDKSGVVKFEFGPQQHLTNEILRKINMIKKLGWLRPIV